MQKGRLSSRLHRKPRLCCCRSSQRSVCSSLETHWAALKQAAFTTHTQTDPVRSINRRRQRLTAQNKQATLAIDCIEKPCLWILHESWPKNRPSLSCPGFERSLEKLYLITESEQHCHSLIVEVFGRWFTHYRTNVATSFVCGYIIKTVTIEQD